MFKKISVFAVACMAFVYGCKKDNGERNASPQSVSMNNDTRYAGYANKGTDNNFSISIPVDSANRMIQSYLLSINYPGNDTGLRALSFNADTLREYLKDTNIKTIDFKLAHRPEYMNNGHFGQASGMNPQALTLILVGLNADGVYVRNNRDQVYEHFRPCPTLCEATTEYIY